MKKILYSSVDTNGRQSSGFVEADSNREALEKLGDMGHAQVRFFGDGTMTAEREQELLAPYNDRTARFLIRIRHRSDLVPVLLQSLHNNKFNLLIGLALALYGWYAASAVSVYLGVGILVLVPLLTAWKHRAARRYDRLLGNCAIGAWQAVLADVAFLRKHQVGLEMAFDLDLREAVASYRLDGDSAAVDALEDWRETFDAEMPGYFESRMASVQHSLGRPDKYVELMRAAFFKSSMSPLIVTDLTLAEARLGEVDKAKTLLKKVAVDELPVEGTAFLHWIRGLIAYRSGQSGALEFVAALEDFSRFGESSALWPAIAVCVADWADQASPAEWAGHAIDENLDAVWPVLEVQAEAEKVQRLSVRRRDPSREPRD